MSKQAADDARARVDAARPAIAASEARVDKARAALGTPGGTTPAVRVAQAEVDKARLDFEHAVMRAPEDGWIARFDLTSGTVVTPGNPLFAIVVIATGILGAWMLTHVDFDVSAASLVIPLVLQASAVGFVFVPLSAIAFATLPTALATEAAGVYSLIRSIGSSIGISIVSVAMTRGAQASFGVLRGYVDPYRPEVRQYLDPLHLKAQGAGLALLARETARCRRKCSAC
jgi:hypothetical protein